MSEITARLTTALAGRLLLVVAAVALPVHRAEGQDAEKLRLSCDDGNATACNNLGGMYFAGEGVSRDLTRAARLFQQACNGGDPKGCYNLGLMGGMVSAGGAQSDTLLRPADSTSLSGLISVFLDDPIANYSKRKIVLDSISASPHVAIFVSAGVTPWVCQFGERGDDLKALNSLLLLVFFAGNAREQLRLGIEGDQPYAGALAVVDLYRRLRARIINYREPSLERWLRLAEVDSLHLHIAEVAADPTAGPC